MNNIFNLPENYMEIVMEELLILVKHGGFTREDVRAMPISERIFHMGKLVEYNTKK